MKASAAFISIFLFAAPASAQEMQHAPANCPADAKPLPAALSAWADKASLDAAGDPAGLNRRGADARQGRDREPAPHPRGAICHPAGKARRGSVAYGGLLQLNVKDTGTYQVNLKARPPGSIC